MVIIALTHQDFNKSIRSTILKAGRIHAMTRAIDIFSITIYIFVMIRVLKNMYIL